LGLFLQNSARIGLQTRQKGRRGNVDDGKSRVREVLASSLKVQQLTIREDIYPRNKGVEGFKKAKKWLS
jgi:hypothetical protein